jgi:hypothetical protein
VLQQRSKVLPCTTCDMLGLVKKHTLFLMHCQVVLCFAAGKEPVTAACSMTQVLIFLSGPTNFNTCLPARRRRASHPPA